MKSIVILFAVLSIVSCDKDSRVLRNLENGKWKITNYKNTKYLGGNITNESTGENIGYFDFEKDGKCNLTMNATLNSTQQTLTKEILSVNLSGGKYEVYGSNDKKYDAKMNIDFDPRNFYTYSIHQDNKSKMHLTDNSNMQSFYGDGYVIEMTIEKE